MFEDQVQDPKVFVAALREYHKAPEEQRGDLVNALSELIISKRVDLAAVRQELIDTEAHELTETLSRLVDLIEPYIEEGGAEE